MADLETRVDKLEEKVEQLEKDINDSLGEIKTDLTEIKGLIEKDSSVIELKVKTNSERITKLENIVSKLTWTIVLGVVGIAASAIVYYIKTGI